MQNSMVAGDTTIAYTPLVLDTTPQPDQDNLSSSLRDYVEGQDYLLQRVVGKVWMGPFFASDPEALNISEVIGCFALAVLPATELGAPGIDPEEWNPLLARNSQQPWIWRRTWRLDNTVDLWPNTYGNLVGFPSTTAGYSSLEEGGHVDARSKRRIIKEHRLFAIAAVGVLQAGGGSADFTNLEFGFDLRVLGTLRRGKNKSSF